MNIKWEITNTNAYTDETGITNRLITIHWKASKERYPDITGYVHLDPPGDYFIPLDYISEEQKLLWVFKALKKDFILEIEERFTGNDL